MTDLSHYTRDQRREAIDQVIVSKRDRLILSLRLLDGCCYQEIADEVHLSVRQVGNIISKGSARIGDYLIKHFL